MAAYVDQSYCGWSHEELPEQNEYQDVSEAQMLDHGSISFGRYACEPLSWEKRSVFTFNKHQEELEKFKSNGLVARKKAYFEEYYKKIRAMKAAKESQQTEITLDYSDNGSDNTSQTEEEKVLIENPIKPIEKRKDEVEAKCGLTTSYADLCNSSNIATHHGDTGSNTSQTEENVPIETSVKVVEKCKDEVEVKHGLTTSSSSLSGNNNVGSQHSDIGSNSSKTEVEKVPIKNSIRLVEKCEDEVAAQCGLLVFDLNSNNFVVDKQQDEIVDTSQKNLEGDINVSQSLEASSEEPKQIEIHHPEDKEATKESDFLVTNVELDIFGKEPKPAEDNSSANNMKVKSAQQTLVPGKVPPSVRKYKDSKTITKMKEPSTSTKISLKVERDAKLDPGKSSNTPKIIRKVDVKSGIGVDSSIKVADKVPKTHKCTNGPRPSSQATNKRSSASSQGRELPSKTSNLKMSSAVKGKEPTKAKTTIHTTLNISQQENATKLTFMTNTIKSKRTEEKRTNEQVKKPPTAKVENRISHKERDTDVPGSSKNRSSSLPPRDRVRPSGVSDMGSKAKMDVNKCEVTRHESKATKASRADTKTTSSKVTRQRTREASDINKVARPRVCGSKQGFGAQSQNSRKNLEQEKPRWR